MIKHQIKTIKKYYGFTLVELIIVITILAILSTIAFVSFSGYTQKTLDSKRLSNLKNITNQINIYYTQKSVLPELSNFKTGNFGGNQVSYVGEIDKDFLNKLSILGFKDDFFMYHFGYSQDKKYFQVATYLKNNISYNYFPTAYANLNEYSTKIDGNYLGVLKYRSSLDNNKYVANIPSLIFYGSGNTINLEDNSTYFSLNNLNNSPLNSTNLSTSEILKQKYGSSATLTGINIENTTISNLAQTFSGEVLQSFGGDLNIIQNSIFDNTKTTDKYCYLSQETLKSGESIKLFSTSNIDKFSSETCEEKSQIFSCNNGIISGDTTNYISKTCEKGVINNCESEPNYTINSRVYNIGNLNHNENISIDYSDISEDNGIFYYTLNASCSDGTLTKTESPRKNKSCNNSYLFDGDNSCLKIGSDQKTPGKTCLDILQKGGNVGNGTYWIKPDSNPAFQVYCDMTTDGGGWSLVASDGLTEYNQSLDNYTSIPTPNQKGIILGLVNTDLKANFTTMKVISTSNNSSFINYDITGSWLGESLYLNDLEHGYLYTADKGFSGGDEGTHKCNFSILVKDTYWCQAGAGPYPYPLNGKNIGAQKGNNGAIMGAGLYSWQFKDGATIFRLGWQIPTSTMTTYYTGRSPSFLMVR